MAALSKRMLMNVTLMPPGGRVADIGCDHAMVPIYLVREGLADYVIAMDVNEGPLDIARGNIKKAHLEDKINKLKLAISEAKIIDVSRLSSDVVQILSKVEMTNLANKAKMSYTIVSENEANLREGKISIKTPIAQGLLGKKVGDEVEIKIPRGTIKLRIENITIVG